MSAEENKAIARRFWEEQDRSNGQSDVVLAPNFRNYIAGNPPQDLQEFKQFAGMFWSAFPDLKHTIEDMVAEGDRVAVRLTARGTHQGDLMGIPPTGKHVVIPAISVLRIVGGRVAEQRAIFDQMGMMQQLGVIPAPA